MMNGSAVSAQFTTYIYIFRLKEDEIRGGEIALCRVPIPTNKRANFRLQDI
jgi:hypothetical protein